jgi:hypothetical protein
MTTDLFKEEEIAILNAVICLEDIEMLQEETALDALIDYARHNSLDQAVTGLTELQAAVAVLIDRGPDLLHALIEAVKRQQHTS